MRISSYGDGTTTAPSGSFWKSLLYPIFGDVPENSVPCSGQPSGNTDASGNPVDNCGNVVGQPLPANAPTELTTYYDPTSGQSYQAVAPRNNGGFTLAGLFPDWFVPAVEVGAVVVGVGLVAWVGYKVVKLVRPRRTA